METEIVHSFLPILNEVGFPIFVTGYLLYTRTKTDKEHLKILEDLKCVSDQVHELLKEVHGKGDKNQ